MKLVKNAVSELTGKVEPATISPEMRADDGRLIADGIADIDLVNMFDAAFDPIVGIIPKCLTDGRPVCIQAQEAHYRKTARQMREIRKIVDREERLLAHQKRIEENREKWGETPSDDEVQQLIRDEPMFVVGIMKLMNKVLELDGIPYKGIRKQD